MKNFKQISDSETEIMKALWEINTPATIIDLLSVLKDKEWKGQTVHTFLTRMINKGFINMKKWDGVNYYSPVLTKQEFCRLEVKIVLDSLYDGSFQNFLVALTGNQQILSKKKAEELEKWLEREETDD